MAAARTVLARLVATYGTTLERRRRAGGSPTVPRRGDAGALDPEDAADATRRGRALVALCAALAAGDVALDRGADRGEVRRRLLELPGIGPWTADYIVMRALGDPDVFLPTDVGVRHALRRLGHDPAGGRALAGPGGPGAPTP